MQHVTNSRIATIQQHRGGRSSSSRDSEGNNQPHSVQEAFADSIRVRCDGFACTYSIARLSLLGKYHSSFERIGPRKANGRDSKQIRSAAREFAHPSDEALGIWSLQSASHQRNLFLTHSSPLEHQRRVFREFVKQHRNQQRSELHQPHSLQTRLSHRNDQLFPFICLAIHL